MAVTPTNVAGPFVPGSRHETVTKVALGASYPTGGEPLTFAQLGLFTVAFACCQVQVAGTGSVITAFYDVVNQKLLCYTATGQVANATDLSAVTIQVNAHGV